MKVIAAYLLARLGKLFPNKEDVKAILASVGAEANDDKIDYLLKQVRGKNVELLIDVGREMMASSAPAAAGGGAAFSAAPAGGAGGGAAPAAEEKKEEKEEKKEESDDEDTLFNLFE